MVVSQIMVIGLMIDGIGIWCGAILWWRVNWWKNMYFCPFYFRWHLYTILLIYSIGVMLCVYDVALVICFFQCIRSLLVRDDIQRWLGISVNGNLVGVDHFRAYGLRIASKKAHRVKYLVWMATTWCIWLHRNSVLFKGKVFDVKVVSNHIKWISHCLSKKKNIKSISWEWFISRVGWNLSCVIANWWVNPLNCLSRL